MKRFDLRVVEDDEEGPQTHSADGANTAEEQRKIDPRLAPSCLLEQEHIDGEADGAKESECVAELRGCECECGV